MGVRWAHMTILAPRLLDLSSPILDQHQKAWASRKLADVPACNKQPGN